MKKRAAGIIAAMTMAFTFIAPVSPIDTYVSAEELDVRPVTNYNEIMSIRYKCRLECDITFPNGMHSIADNGNTAVIDLNGHTLTYDSTKYAILNQGTLTITDSSRDGSGKITNKGSGVCILNGEYGYSGTLTIEGGNITGCNHSNADSLYQGNGGGIYNSNNSTLNITGGSISGNTSGMRGGGVFNDGTLNMSGGSITGNTAKNDGGGIYNKGTLNISGGSITGNTGSGISNYGTLNISGKVTITDNTIDEDSYDLVSSKIINVTGDLTGSQIGVGSFNSDSAFTTGYKKYNPTLSPADVFFANEKSYAVTLIDGEAASTTATDTRYKVQYKWKKQDDDKYTCTVTIDNGTDIDTKEYPDLDGSLNIAYENDINLILSSSVPAASSGLEARIRNGELTMKVTYKAAEGYITGIGFNVNGTKDVEKNGFKAYSATYYVKVGAEGGVTITPYYIDNNGKRVNGESTTIAG